MSDTFCPQLISASVINTDVSVDSICAKELCGYYDKNSQQCSQVSQAQSLREIAAYLAKLVDKQECESPVEVELQPVRPKITDCKW